LVIRKAPIDFMVSMTFSRAEEPAERLTITLEYQAGAPFDVTLKVVWGILQLTAPVQMMGLE